MSAARKAASRGFHEDFRRDHATKRGSDRSFGLVFCAFFVVVGLWPLWGNGAPRWWVLVFSVLFLATAILRPAVLAPFNKLWQRFGLLLHRLTSPIILFLMYVVAIVPTGLVLRLLRKDLLRLRWDPTATSYWIEREPGPKPETMRNQF